MKRKAISDIKNKEEARQIAIEWQQWQSERSMFLSEMLEWQNYFKILAEKFAISYR